MIQIAQKLFQEPKAAEATLQTTLGALRTAIIVFLQSAERKKPLHFNLPLLTPSQILAEPYQTHSSLTLHTNT